MKKLLLVVSIFSFMKLLPIDSNDSKEFFGLEISQEEIAKLVQSFKRKISDQRRMSEFSAAGVDPKRYEKCFCIKHNIERRRALLAVISSDEYTDEEKYQLLLQEQCVFDNLEEAQAILPNFLKYKEKEYKELHCCNA